MNVPKTLIVGLGNYTMHNTRHSVGMLFVDRLAATHDAKWESVRSVYGNVAQFRVQKANGIDHDLILLKPKLFMNVNGKSVGKTCAQYLNNNWREKNRLYLVHDELEKSFGKWTIKEKGSASGHNGVRSVHQVLASQDMPRLRIGIGKPSNKSDVAAHVLQGFNRDEREKLDAVLDACAKDLVARL
ncbi:peptidyl-tRNA hydrolase [Sphaeroforma arctica JP610]|uniref:peptidyl-tRNA hydrolase n=1 Tax=Sphaeroforma arctica JP610 TaxID=667725 RepID=A0A0L0FPQ3_9EUKA|nr:peptidyl-tRNA hydrolase [Sphaeroforma arctica JP610]KNC78782.1 peptidyl-tRNA hydrolase [Sphaeroforma arctica JP610]|eukprot:XP_014152684.1 peptidyl-tRNA hydrolase [Sphaeroforma arctica JP610]